MGDGPIEAKAHIVAVLTTTPALSLTPSRKDPAAEVVDSVKQIFTPRSLDTIQYHFPEHMKKPWEILLKRGYTPRKGLGLQEQGMTDALETPEEHNGMGLGYS